MGKKLFGVAMGSFTHIQAPQAPNVDYQQAGNEEYGVPARYSMPAAAPVTLPPVPQVGQPDFQQPLPPAA